MDPPMDKAMLSSKLPRRRLASQPADEPDISCTISVLSDFKKYILVIYKLSS